MMLHAVMWRVLIQCVSDVWTVLWCCEVKVTQLITFVPLYSCNNNITLKKAAIATETCW
jgi:hypothetical protein